MARDASGVAKRQVDVDVGARHARHLRPLNLDRVLAFAIAQSAPFTRTEVIAATGLSAPTVGTLCAYLIRCGVVKDLGAAPSRGGRRPTFMEFNARHRFVAGIDIGPTKTRLAVADLRGEPIQQRVVATPTDCAPADLLSQIAADLRKLLSDSRVPANRLLAVVGERWRGAARGHDTCAFITVGTGIGAGVVVNGELYHGRRFMAGEIALMCMGPQFVDTDFGARGCLETLAGLKAIAARWSQSDHAPVDGWVRDLFDAARAGDQAARAIVDDTATLIGIAAANVSIVLDPSLIVLGGALFAQAPELVDAVRRVVSRIVPTPGAIVPSELDKEAPLWGSLLVAAMEARKRLRQQLREDVVAD